MSPGPEPPDPDDDDLDEDDEAEPPSIARQTDIPAAIPMQPLGSDEDSGVFTPASLMRYVAQSGGGILLAPGDHGPAVERLQHDLEALGLFEEPLGEEFGQFGPMTEEALSAFQEANGFVVTGKCDNRTRAVLREAAKGREDE